MILTLATTGPSSPSGHWPRAAAPSLERSTTRTGWRTPRPRRASGDRRSSFIGAEVEVYAPRPERTSGTRGDAGTTGRRRRGRPHRLVRRRRRRNNRLGRHAWLVLLTRRYDDV